VTIVSFLTCLQGEHSTSYAEIGDLQEELNRARDEIQSLRSSLRSAHQELDHLRSVRPQLEDSYIRPDPAKESIGKETQLSGAFRDSTPKESESEDLEGKDEADPRRRLINQRERTAVYTHGSQDLVPGITVIGAVILSEAGNKNLAFQRTWKDGGAGDGNATDMAAVRAQHARNMYSQLPFPTVEWPPVFTKPCPQHIYGHKTERGLALAHYQIWLEFIYFDNDVIQDVRKKKVKDKYESTWWTSHSGSYIGYANGTMTKNGIPFREDDIIVIFEDDADIAVIDINQTMKEELSTMTTDILYLGWCDGRAARPVPLCAHAYALTRRGARKAVEHFEPCGLALDEQLVVFGKNKWLSFRTAHSWSYRDRFTKEYPKAHDNTFGIFHQKRMGSFNGH
jgi:hypothetical protein